MTENQSHGPQMTPSQPYLLRALNEWLVDNGMTPQILVDTAHPSLQVPDSLRAQEKLVLNISPSAVRDLQIDNDFVSFVARFSGISQGVIVPVKAVLAIYARENGHGMMFPESDSATDDEPDPNDSSTGADQPKRPRSRATLRVIK